ncbi:hypothetical protein [Pseudomonas sp. 22 E 5]|nr:hypothetical protein [Pseudomonas sp. 22 E 5]
MRKVKKQEISFIDWGGKIVGAVGVLGMAAYIAGYFKFYFLYSALNCSWVLPFHSVQDVVANGVVDVFFCALTAVPLFFYYRTSLEIDSHGRRIVGLIVLGSLISIGIGVRFLGYVLDVYVSELMVYGASYLFQGVFIANVARYSSEKGSYEYIAAGFLLFVFASCFSSYLVNSTKTFAAAYEKGAFPYAAVEKQAVAGVLVGSVNGKYLLRLCQEKDKFKLISPSYKWTIEKHIPGSCGISDAIN